MEYNSRHQLIDRSTGSKNQQKVSESRPPPPSSSSTSPSTSTSEMSSPILSIHPPCSHHRFSFRLLLLSLLYCFLLLPSQVHSKTLIGLIDRLSFDRPTDYAKLGEFCFTIPEGTRGSIDSEVVIAEDGHRLILLKDDDEASIRSNSSLKEYTPHKRRQLSQLLSDLQSSFPEVRRFLEAEEESETIEATEATEADTPSNTTTAGKTAVADKEGVGVPRKEGSASRDNDSAKVTSISVEPHANKDNVGEIKSGSEQSQLDLVPMGVAAHPSKVESIEGQALPPIVISDDPARWPIQATTVCDALVERARVTETLKPVGKLSSYHLVLWVEPHIDGHRVSLIITRCGGDPYAEYRIELKNPGSFLKAHYSCEDQGLLELYFVAFIGSLALLIPLRRLWNVLAHTRKEHPVIDVFFLAALSCVINIGFDFVHLFAYAFNGLGFSVLIFLGQLAELVFVVSTCFVISWLLSLGHSNGSRMLNGIASPNTEEDEDEQKLISSENRFRTADALFTTNTTLQTRLRVAHQLLSNLTSPDHLLAALAFSVLIVVFLATIKSSPVTDPLLPGWRVSHPHWDRTFTGLILFIAILVYFVTRFLFAAQIIKELFQSPPSQIRHDDIAVRRHLALTCSFLWLVTLPILAIFPVSFLTINIKHGSQFGLLAINFVVLVTLGRCLIEKPSTLLNFFNSYKILPTSGDSQQRSENSGLVSTLGKRSPVDQSLSGYTTAASSSHASGPSFPTPAWDRDEEDEQRDGAVDDSEPELIDVSQLPKATSSVFGYSTLG